MAHQPQIKIPATYMRGGTSKGVFFRLQDLPQAAQVPGTGKDGRVTKGDVLGAMQSGAAGASQSSAAAAKPAQISTGAPTSALPQVASPAAPQRHCAGSGP